MTISQANRGQGQGCRTCGKTDELYSCRECEFVQVENAILEERERCVKIVKKFSAWFGQDFIKAEIIDRILAGEK